MRLLRSLCPLFLAVTGTLAHAQATVISAPVSVGQTSSPIAVTVKFSGTGIAGALSASTQGTSVADFALTSGGTCTAGLPTIAGLTCTANVTFSPKYPGVRSGAVLVKDSGGNVLGTGMVSGIGKGSLGVFNPGEFDTVAGSSAWIYRGDGMVATQAQIFLPQAIVSDAAGNIYIADSGNNRIRKVDGTTNTISTIAGNGTPGYSGDGGLATLAEISNPSGIALDGAGNVFFVDSSNNIVRRIDAATGTISTVAGTPGQQGSAGDGGVATSAQLALPEGLAIDQDGNLYIGDTGNHEIREVIAATGVIQTIAGTGKPGYNGDNQPSTKAMLNTPWGITVAPDGSVYFADLNNHRIREVTISGQITTVVGTGSEGFSGDGGPAVNAGLNSPAAVALDPAGNLYVADSGNNRVRKVYVGTGIIQTIIGSTDPKIVSTYNPDSVNFGTGWPDIILGLYGPYSIFVDQAGNIFVANLFYNNVARASASAVTLHYSKLKVTKVSPPQPVALENDGNDKLTPTTPVFVNAAVDPSTTTCSTAVLTSGATCNYGVEFAPLVTGDTVTGTATENTDAVNSPNVVTVVGQVLAVEPTTLAITSSENPSLIGDSVTFTGTVTSDDTGRTGTVTFFDGTTTLCNQATLNSNGFATCTVTTLALGSHTISATYSGDANNAAATSPNLTQVVLQTPTLVLSASPNPQTVTQNVILTLQASAATGTPTGNVQFFDGPNLLSTVALDASGKATITTSQLTPGAHSLTASYSGDSTDAPGTSNIVSEQINQAPTSTTLGTSNATVPVGTNVTFTANVYSSNGPAPTGTVTFSDGKVALGTGTVNSSGVATFSTTALVPGGHSIVATYNGDTNDANSSSSALTETVLQLGTVTSILSDANPANAGATFHLTASVVIASGATADGAITGSVTFMAGAKTLGSANVDASGNAVLTLSNLAVGSYAIVATYNGNVNYTTSSSSALSQVVQMTSTTTALGSSSVNSLSGKQVTFTATVTSATGGIPTSAVTFKDGSVVIGTGTVNAQGVATFTTSSLAIGNHNITAVYSGDGNYSGSTSSPVVEVITQGTTGLTLSGPGAPVNAGTLVTVTAALSTNGVAPTGTLTLSEGANVIGTQNVTAAGTFTFNPSSLSIGTHVLVANYGGDTNDAAATSNTISVTIQQATSSTAVSSSLNPAVVGQNIVFTATVTSSSPNLTGSVTFMDGTTSMGSVPVAANASAVFSISTLAAGSHLITAVYAGDTNHATSTSSVLNQNVVQPATAAVMSSLNPAVSGNNIIFTAKVSGVGSVVPTGKLTFTDGANTLAVATLDAAGTATFSSATLAIGSHTIGVSYAGDSNNSTATASLIETIGNANTTVVLTTGASPAVYGAPLALTAVVTSNGGVATGKITFTDGSATVGSASLDATGTAVLSTTSLTPGSHSLVANYAGDGKASASVSTPVVVVVKELTTVTVTTSNNPEYTLNPITFTAAVTNAGVGVPTGVVTFTDGTVALGSVNLDSTGHATVTVPSMTAGNHSIVASYAGDNVDFANVSAALTQGVTLRPTTTTLSSTQADPTNPLAATLIAVVHWNGTAAAPTGKVTFTTGSTTIGSAAIDASGVATMTITLNAQTESIVASYNGDTAYASSASLATTITGSAATQFTMAISPGTATVVSKQRTTINVMLNSVSSFTDMMQFGCLGLPYAATCTFSKDQGMLASNGNMTVQLTIDTGDPLGSGATASARNESFGASKTVLAFLPVGLLAAVGMFRRRKRMMPTLLIALVALLATMGMTGCAGLSTAGTPAGTYAFKVTASGTGTGATQSAVMNLTVTQ